MPPETLWFYECDIKIGKWELILINQSGIDICSVDDLALTGEGFANNLKDDVPDVDNPSRP